MYRVRGLVRFVKRIFLKILTYNLKNHVSLGLSLALSITKDNSVRFEIRFLCFDWRLLRPAEISIWSRVKQSALFRSKETNSTSQTQISQKRDHPRKSMFCKKWQAFEILQHLFQKSRNQQDLATPFSLRKIILAMRQPRLAVLYQAWLE